jgi:hypothetical protein
VISGRDDVQDAKNKGQHATITAVAIANHRSCRLRMPLLDRIDPMNEPAREKVKKMSCHEKATEKLLYNRIRGANYSFIK